MTLRMTPGNSPLVPGTPRAVPQSSVAPQVRRGDAGTFAVRGRGYATAGNENHKGQMERPVLDVRSGDPSRSADRLGLRPLGPCQVRSGPIQGLRPGVRYPLDRAQAAQDGPDRTIPHSLDPRKLCGALRASRRLRSVTVSRHIDLTPEQELLLRLNLAIDNSDNMSPEILVKYAAKLRQRLNEVELIAATDQVIRSEFWRVIAEHEREDE